MSQLLQKYLDYTAPLKGSNSYHTFAFLSVISALLERKTWLDRGRIGIIFPNTYTFLIGPPATGKSTAADLAIDFLQKVTAEKRPHFGPSKITQAALYKELKDAGRVYNVEGQGALKQSPLFLYASELSRSMEDFGGGLLTSELIDFYDSKGHNSLIKKRTIKDDTLIFNNPSITFLGCTTQDYLSLAATGNIITSGLSSRIMLVVETERVEKMRHHVALDATLQREILFSLNNTYAMQGAFVLQKDAYDLLINESEACDAASYDAAIPLLQNYFGRKPDHITKVAMALAACDATLNIRAYHIKTASALLKQLEPNLPLAFGTRDIVKDVDAHAQILSCIPYSPGRITRSELLQKLSTLGKFVSINGTWESIIKGMQIAGTIQREATASEEIYTRQRK